VNTVLTPAALEATKGLARLVLQRECERNQHPPDGAAQALADLQQQLDAVPSEALLAAIRRHRLECLLHGDPLVAGLLPELASTLQALARQEAMAALALASLTREVARLFEQAGIPMMVFKGIPLALQTTGSLTARGRGDLDVLVDPRRLPEAVVLLESAGFVRCPGQFPRQLNSGWGRYSRWAGYEFSLIRKVSVGIQCVDLHWALSNVRGPLPSFGQAWQCSERLDLNGQWVASLSLVHAFRHACAHAAKDQWMCLRNVIDIDRLSHRLSGHDLTKLQNQPTVRWSCAVAHAATRNQLLRLRTKGQCSGTRKAILRANHTQVTPWRCQGLGSWTPRHWATIVWWQLLLSRNGLDWLRVLLYFSLLPAAFSNQDTGEDCGLAGFLQSRLTRLMQRLGERSASNPEDTASEQEEDSRQQARATRLSSASPVRSRCAQR